MPTGPSSLPPPLSKHARLGDPYVVAGDRAYLIGRQDGGFAFLGDHIPGEMGGLWAHPHKLLDGFWCAIVPADDPPSVQRTGAHWLPAATRFESAAWGVTQWFELPDGLALRRNMLVPDGRPALLIDLYVEDSSGHNRTVEIAFVCRSKLRPGWLDTREDGVDTLSVADDGVALVASDGAGPWWVAWGGAERPVSWRLDADAPEPSHGNSATAAQRFRIAVPAAGEARLRLAVYGSTVSEDDAVAGLRDVYARAEEIAEAKRERLAADAALSRLDVPEPALVRAWEWTRCCYDWLRRDVPGVGRGLGAGLPEYPWWFGCDASYALRGLLPLGDFATAAATLRLLARVSYDANGDSGRIVHELSCTGHVFNPGNAQETPQFACAVFETYLWSGDRSLLDDLYPFCRAGVLGWTLGACDADGDLLPEGYGITEMFGLDTELIDSAVWAHEGLRAVGRMAALLGDAETAARCAALAPRLREAIERRFWLPDAGLYADWIATPRDAIPRLARMYDDALRQSHAAADGGGAVLAAHLLALRERAERLPQDDEAAWYLGNWVINAPLEAGLTPPERATGVLDRLEGAEFCGPAGVYLSGITRSRAMSISTAALAAAECAYGRTEQALRLCRLLAGTVTLRMPGAVSEFSPDGGCFVQAWSGYGTVYPLAAGVFGLFPDAAARRLVVAPALPSGWPHARLRHVRVGAAYLDVELLRAAAGGVECRLTIDQEGWVASVRAPGGALPLTPLTVHAAQAGETWGLAPQIDGTARRVELEAGVADVVAL